MILGPATLCFGVLTVDYTSNIYPVLLEHVAGISVICDHASVKSLTHPGRQEAGARQMSGERLA